MKMNLKTKSIAFLLNYVSKNELSRLVEADFEIKYSIHIVLS